MTDKAALLRELAAYRDRLDAMNEGPIGEALVRTVDEGLDRAREYLGDDQVPSLIPPEAVMDGTHEVWSSEAAVIVAGVVARLQDPPQTEVELGEGPPWGWSYRQRPQGFKRTW